VALSSQAIVQADEFSVIFDGQDAAEPAYPAGKTVTLPAETVDALPSEPMKAGMIFAGWSTAPHGYGTEFSANTPVTENISVYAMWPTQGLEYTLINNDNEYSVRKGSADTAGSVVIPG
jgi:uncharacterized repeat protein (TIGR02543 family)